MNRCPTPPRGLLAPLVGLLIGLAGLPPPLAAQTLPREFPPQAQRGVLEIVQPPHVRLNGQAEQLSPGARIRNPDNRIVLSASLVGQPLRVNYLREPHGLIHEVWILSEAETEDQRSGMPSSVNFLFASDADKAGSDDGKTPFHRLPKFNQGQ